MFSVKRNKAHFILYRKIQLILRIFFRLLYRVKIEGLTNILQDKRMILCSNHISYLDPVILDAFFPSYIYFMAKSELFKIPLLSSFVSFFNAFPVKRNTTDMKSIKTSIKVLENEKVLGLFPEGTRSTEGKLLEGQKGISFIAIKTESPVLPVAISGTNKIVQKPRKRLFFPEVKVKFGEVIDTADILEKHGKKRSETIILEETMRSIRRLYESIN